MGNVVLIACTNVGRALIEAVLHDCASAKLSGVVNLRPEAAVGKANYDPYTDLVLKYGLNAYYCDNVNEPECAEFLRKCEPDIIIQSGWSQKFGPEILEIPKFACVGEHPAPLPKGRGAACVNWAIITGEREWGDTFFRMENQYDTGVIYAQERFTIEEYDDVKSVYDKVAAAAARSVRGNLDKWLTGNLEGWAQDDAAATHYPRRRPENGLFDFRQSRVDIYNQIRGQAKPYPGAFFYAPIDGVLKKVYVWKASLDNGPVPGGLKVKCADGEITFIRVQAEGEPEAWACERFTEIPQAADMN